MMKRISILLVALTVGLAPILAEARAGGRASVSAPAARSVPSRTYAAAAPAPRVQMQYQSQGSKGVNTYKQTQTYQPVARTQTAAPAPQVARQAAPVTTYPRGNVVAAAPAAGVSSTTVNHTTINHVNTGGGYGNNGGPGLGSTALAAGGGALIGTMLGNHLSQPAAYGPGYAPGYGQPGYVAGAPMVAGAAPVVAGAPMVAGAAPAVVDANGVPVGGAVVGGTAGYAVGAPIVAAPVVATSSFSFLAFLGNMLLFFLAIGLIILLFWGIARLISRQSQKDEYEVISHTSVHHHHDASPVYVSEVVEDATTPLHVSGADKADFKNVLLHVQNAWSNRDKPVLHGLLTAEMFDYFTGAMDDNTRDGVINKVENVSGIECDVLEAWSEESGDYATAIMRWNAHDYTTDLSGRTIDAGATEYVRETWTFKRQHGNWVLSAVQQMAD